MRQLSTEYALDFQLALISIVYDLLALGLVNKRIKCFQV